jgi:hypothetical protein
MLIAMRWSRVLLLVLTVTSCTHRATSGPAWPKLHVADPDAGESLGPHANIQSVANELESEPVAAPPPKETPLVKPGMPDLPVEGSGLQLQEVPPEDGAMTGEDQVIEVTDDKPSP